MSSSDKIRKIAIVRLSALGDIIHTLPVLPHLKKRFPEASITWFAEPSGAALLSNFNLIDEIVTVKLKNRSVLSSVKEVRKILKQHRGNFDVILDFQGLIKSAVLSALLKGRKLGFHKDTLREKEAAVFYTERATWFDDSRHVIKKNLHLLTTLGIEATKIKWPLKQLTVSHTLQKFLEENGLLNTPYIILNIGAGWPTKRLTEEQNRSLLEKISAEYPVTILWGNNEEQKAAKRLENLTGVPAVPFLKFDELFSLVRMSSTIITPDTMALHIADMVQTPSIGIFGPTSPERNGSLNPESHTVLKKCSEAFCYKRKCDKMECIADIDIDHIFSILEEIL